MKGIEDPGFEAEPPVGLRDSCDLFKREILAVHDHATRPIMANRSAKTEAETPLLADEVPRPEALGDALAEENRPKRTA